MEALRAFQNLEGQRASGLLSVWHILCHVGIQAALHYTSADFFLLLSSIWGLINLVSGMKSIVATPLRARESGKHSDSGGTC